MSFWFSCVSDRAWAAVFIVLNVRACVCAPFFVNETFFVGEAPFLRVIPLFCLAPTRDFGAFLMFVPFEAQLIH